MATKHLVLSIRDLLMLRDDPNRWIINDFMQKSNRILVFGESNTYKSAIIFDLCVAVASEKGKLFRWLDVNHHGPVLCNSTEGSIFDTKDRLISHIRTHGLDAKMPLYVCQLPFRFDEGPDIQAFRETLDRLKPVLVVLDPLDSFFSGDENSAKETKAIRRQIDAYIDEYKCTFILIHHQAKANKDTKGVKPTPRGSGAWAAWADTVVHVSCNKKKIGMPAPVDIITVETTKQRNGPKGKLLYAMPTFLEYPKRIRFDYFDGKDPAKIAVECWKAKILNLLQTATSPMTNRMIAEALQVRSENVAQPLLELEKEGQIAKDAGLARSCGPNGEAVRMVPAWRAMVPIFAVDATAIMVKDEEDEMRQFGAVDLDRITQLEPPPSAYSPDDSGVREAGAEAGPGVPPVL